MEEGHFYYCFMVTRDVHMLDLIWLNMLFNLIKNLRVELDQLCVKKFCRPNSIQPNHKLGWVIESEYLKN